MATQVQFCPFCGKQVLAADATFCAYCGRSFPDGSAQAQAQQAGQGRAAVPPIPAPPVNALYASMQVSQPGQLMAPAGYPVYPVPLVGPGANYAGMAPVQPPATSTGRALGVMFGMIGLLLILALVGIFLPYLFVRSLYGSFSFYMTLSTFFSSVSTLLPLTYWLSLARLRFAGAWQVLGEALGVSVAFTIVLYVFDVIINMLLLPYYRAYLPASTVVFGLILPIFVGAGLGLGAALLFARWRSVRQRTQASVALRDIAIVYGTVLGCYLVYDVINALTFARSALIGVRVPIGVAAIFDLIFYFALPLLLGVGLVVLASLLTLVALRRVRPQPPQPFAYAGGVAPSAAGGASQAQPPQTPTE